MNPDFINLFGHPIKWYGVLTAAGFLAAVAHWNHLARREGLDPQMGSEMGVWCIVSGILGARLAYVLAHPQDYLAHPLEILRIWHGGQIFYGGLIAGILAFCVLARRRRWPLAWFADFSITAVPLGHAIGRVGCFMNGCCHGHASDVPWAIPLGGARVHPTPLYEALANLVVYAILRRFYPRRSRDGTVLALYLLLYPAARFGLEFTRGDERQHWGALTVAQGVSLAMLAAGAALWFLLPARKIKAPLHAEPAGTP